MRFVHVALLLLSGTTLTLAQEPPVAEPKEAPGKPILAVDSNGHEASVGNFDFTPDGKKLFTISVDNTIQVWDAVTREHLKTYRLPWKQDARGKLVGFVQSASKLAVAPDGKTLAMTLSNIQGIGTGGYELYLISLDTGRLLPLPGIAKNTNVEHLTFSRDGDMLAAGVRHEGMDKSIKAKVFLWRGLQKVSDLEAPALTLGKEWKSNHFIADLAFAPDGSQLAVSYAFPGGPIDLFNLKDLEAAPRTIDPEAKLKTEHSVVHLAWSPEGRRLVAEVHDLRQGKALPPRVMIWTPDGTLLRSMETTLSARPVFRNENELLMLTITHVEKNRSPWKDVVVSRFDLQKNSHEELVRCTLPEDEAAVTSYKIAPEYQRSALSNKGHELAILELEPKGQVQPLKVIQVKPQFAVSMKSEHRIAWTGNEGTKLIAGIDLRTAEPLAADDLNPENFGPLGKPKVNNRGMVEVEIRKVKFTVFAAGQDWIFMTPQGYYAATPGGEKLVGWHINNGSDKLASFSPCECFHNKLYRPDVLKLLHDNGTVAQALRVANELLPKGTVPDNEPVANLDKLLPPVVELRVVDKSKLPVVKLKVSARAGTKEQPLKSLRLLVDGRVFNDGNTAIAFSKDGVPKDEREWTVELPDGKEGLPDGKHQVAVFARSADASSLSNTVEIDCRPATEKPVLHVLAIGVSEYKNKDLNLDSPHKDAELLAKTFKSQCKGNLFGEVRTTVLLNKDATADAVRDAVKKLRTDPKAKVKANDLVIVFFAGHGAKEKDQFYLLPQDANVDDLANTALSGRELRDSLGAFPCQVLLMMDACHSGAFGAKGKFTEKHLKPATDDATRTLTDDEVGVAVMCAAMGNEKAEERKGNGLFTEAVVEALTANKDVPFNHLNHRQYVHHLQAYVFDKVAAASLDKQHPFLHLPWVVESFALRDVAGK